MEAAKIDAPSKRARGLTIEQKRIGRVIDNRWPALSHCTELKSLRIPGGFQQDSSCAKTEAIMKLYSTCSIPRAVNHSKCGSLDVMNLYEDGRQRFHVPDAIEKFLYHYLMLVVWLWDRAIFWQFLALHISLLIFRHGMHNRLLEDIVRPQQQSTRCTIDRAPAAETAPQLSDKHSSLDFYTY